MRRRRERRDILHYDTLVSWSFLLEARTPALAAGCLLKYYEHLLSISQRSTSTPVQMVVKCEKHLFRRPVRGIPKLYCFEAKSEVGSALRERPRLQTPSPRADRPEA